MSFNNLAQWNTQSPVPTYLDVRGIGAPTTQRVFIATDDNSFDNGGSLFESNDGGSTWVQLNIPVTLSSPFYGLFFLDSQNGWVYEAEYPQWNIGYQYFGGVTNWYNDKVPYDGPSRSPVKVSSSKPTWVLAADCVMKINNAWGGTDRDVAYANMPQHVGPGSKRPVGGNGDLALIAKVSDTSV